MGIKIVDIKVVGLCSKCRKNNDDIKKDKHGRVYTDDEISCINSIFGGDCCKIKMKNKCNDCNDCKKRKGIIEFSDNPYMALTHGWKTILICRKCYIKRIEEHLTEMKKHLLNQKKYLMVEEK